jgi:zinc protease
MIKRRHSLFRNIWWILVIVIIAGVAADHFLMHKKVNKINVTRSSENNSEYMQAGPLLDIQTWKTARGLEVFFLPIENLPITDVQLIFAAGSAYDESTPGISQLTNQLIGKNTHYLTTDAITEGFESFGAIFSASVTRDAAMISLRTLSFDEDRLGATDLLTKILADIQFSEQSLSLEKQLLLTSLAAQAQSPQAQSTKAFFAHAYNAHPYASPILGDVASVNAITLDQVKAFYQRYYNIDNAIVVVVGDVTIEEAHQMAEKFDSALPLGNKAAEIPAVSLPMDNIVEHIDFPSTQNHIILGMPTLEKSNPDYFAFFVGNEILGGSGLSSQLFEAIREKEGLAYSISSQIQTLKQKGPFFISLQTRNNESEKALALVKEHLDNFIAVGPSTQELKTAKQNIAGTFLMAFNSNAAIAHHVATLAFYQLPLDFYDSYLEKINAVTLDDIKRVFNDHVGSQKMVTITLGVDNTVTNNE